MDTAPLVALLTLIVFPTVATGLFFIVAIAFGKSVMGDE